MYYLIYIYHPISIKSILEGRSTDFLVNKISSITEVYLGFSHIYTMKFFNLAKCKLGDTEVKKYHHMRNFSKTEFS